MSCQHNEVQVIKRHSNINPETLMADTEITGYECVDCKRWLPPGFIKTQPVEDEDCPWPESEKNGDDDDS